MSAEAKTDEVIKSMDEEIQFIETNRAERNKKYNECLHNYKKFLKGQTEQFQSTEKDNCHNKELVSQAFENTFERVLNASDLTIRKIKQTYNQKKIFWDNVIKLNSGVSDIQLKREFYQQKRNAQEGYLEAVDRQKDKHKPYKVLISTEKKKEGLRQFQLNNRKFEEKVAEGTNTLQQWQNMTNNNIGRYVTSPTYQYDQPRGVLNQFVDTKYIKSMNAPQSYPLNPNHSVQVENSVSFLNNFQRKR